MPTPPISTPAVRHGDLTPDDLDAIRQARLVAIDTETTGLQWDADRLVMVQLMAPGQPAVLVRLGEQRPELLISLIEDPDVAKIFHYAMFDLRFMSATWGIRPATVRCTKVCAKLVRPHEPAHSLAWLVHHYLGVQLDKSEQCSDWTAETLSPSQIAYAVRDVQFLLPLMAQLRAELLTARRWDVAKACFAFLPVQLEIDRLGVDAVFRH